MSSPRITDFGLAKLQGGGAAGQTQSGAVIGTPAYMAPEQAAGKTRDITTAVDVYALGVILYEVLTGRPPFSGATALEILRQVEAQEPPPPRRRRPRLPRDLETICLKCLDKDPGRRYASAAALADDLRRFRAGEPVQARPAGAAERLLRWCRRKPALAGLTLALVLAVAAGTLGVLGQWRRAEQKQALAEAKSRKARQAVYDYFILVSENKLLGKPGYQELRRDLLETALRHYQEFLAERTDDPAVQEEVAATQVCVAVIYGLIGSKEAAGAAYREAIALYERLAAATPAETKFPHLLARTCRQWGALLAESDKLDEALDAFARARAVHEGLMAGHGADPAWQSELAQTHLGIALAWAKRGRRDEALRAVGQALPLLHEVAGAQPERPDRQLNLSEGYIQRGNLYFAENQWAEALTAYREAQAIDERLAAAHPAEDRYKVHLVETYNQIGAVASWIGPVPEAIDLLRKGRALAEQLAYDNPTVTDYQWLLARTYARLDKLYGQASQPEKGLDACEQARPLVERLIRVNPTLPDYRKLSAELFNDRGHFQSHLDRPAEALSAFERACAMMEQLVQEFPNSSDYQHFLGITYHNRGNELNKAGRRDEALRVYEKGLDLRARLVQTDPGVPNYQYHLALLYNKVGLLHEEDRRFAPARENFRQAVRLCAQLHQAHPKFVVYERLLATSFINLGNVECRLGEWAEAERLYVQALDICRKFARAPATWTGAHTDLALANCALGELKLQTEDFAAALRYCEQARDGFEKDLQNNSRNPHSRSGAGRAWDGLGRALAASGRPDEALKAFRQAIGHQRTVLDMAPNQVLYRERLDQHYEHLARLHRELGQAAEASAVCRDRQQLWPNDPLKLVAVACEIARCIPVVGRGKDSRTPQEEAERGRYAGQAIEVLRQAIAQGYRPGSRRTKVPK